MSLPIVFLAMILFSVNTQAITLNIEILMDDIYVHTFKTLAGATRSSNVHKFNLLGSKYNVIKDDFLHDRTIDKISFSFDDELGKINIPNVDVEQRIIQWFTKGWRCCVKHEPNQGFFYTETDNICTKCGLACPERPGALIYWAYALFNIDCYDSRQISFKDTLIRDEKLLKAGQLVAVKNGDNYVQIALHLANEMLLIYEPVHGQIYFQSISQYREQWIQSSEARLVAIVAIKGVLLPETSPPKTLNGKDLLPPHSKGYMLESDAMLPPEGSYLN